MRLALSLMLAALATYVFPSDTVLRKKPLSPEFVAFQQQQMRGAVKPGVRVSGSGLPHFGHIPSPVWPGKRPSFTASGQTAVASRGAHALPARYDSREMNRVTPVRNQASCGACWSFAAMGTIESSLLPDEDSVFSPEHLILNHGFDYGRCEGGNPWMSLAYLSRWGGPLKEKDYPYAQGNSTQTAVPQLVNKHVQEVVFLPDRAHALDNSIIKQYLMNEGALLIGYYADDAYLNPATAAYYCNDPQARSNHEVVVVGWDDAYSASNFSIPPPGDGAFIVKNSWGTSWGDDGFFYLSYYDEVVYNFVSFKSVAPVTDFSTNYGHDALGWCTDFGYGRTNAWGANIFTARNNQPLTAIGLVLNTNNARALIHVHVGGEPGRPATGDYVAQQLFSMPYAGYYTVPLSEPIPLTKGQIFSVTVQFANNVNYTYPLPVEYPIQGYSSQVESAPGQSYVSLDAANWEDLADSGANMCIKAFAQAYDLALDLSVRRETVTAWMISRDAAVLDLSALGDGLEDLSRVIVFRRDMDGKSFEVWKEISAAELSSGTFRCADTFLEDGRSYTYKAAAVDADGQIMAVTPEALPL